MIPNKLGRFQIVREIGRGAMGQVFLADDPKIERQVAIKTIAMPPGTSPEEAGETSRRFLREAQAAGKLLHPNIVTIFDVGEESGVAFIAMEYIDGVTLDRHARPDTLLPPAQVLHVIVQAAAALDYAHQSQVIHRDIKPANLMMLRDGTVKVTDFGLAKKPSANLTQTGVLLGTPSYMSPEQIQGKDLDGRSDLFALGVVLYELLTGVRPFNADSISTIIYRVLYEDPRPPAAHNSSLPAEVNLVIEKALAKAPDKRYPTGAALVSDLRKAFAALPPETVTRPFPRAVGAGGPAPAGMASRDGSAAAGPATRRATPRPPRRASVPSPAPPPTLIAHHPFKLAALIVTVVAGLAVFPRWVNRAERTDPVRATGPAAGPVSGASVSPASVGGAPPGARTVSIIVETMPHGGTVFLDGLPLAEPRVVLSANDRTEHEIQARAGCMEATAEMTAADLASFNGPLVMELRPRRETVLIGSEPAGARLHLNGRDTGKTTPIEVELDSCEEQVVELRREGLQPWSRTFAVGGDFAAMADTLREVALRATPKGTLMVRKPKGYPVEIYAGVSRIGRAGEAVTLQEGKHALTFRNDAKFVHQTLTVNVEGGQTVTPAISFPDLGSLSVQAQPSNCKVYIDDRYVDVTPILDLPMAAGDHRVKVVFVPTGASKETRVQVEAGKTARVTVKF